MDKNSKFSVKRRAALKKSLKGAVATGVVATSHGWSRPVVESIVVPAHATTTGCDLTISNITLTITDDPASPLLSASNPVSGANLGSFDVDCESNQDGDARLNASGMITPPPPPGTNVLISVSTSVAVADSYCFFLSVDSGPCAVEVPVNSTNGDFSLLNQTINGLDDDSNTVTMTFTSMDCPSFVVDFSWVWEGC